MNATAADILEALADNAHKLTGVGLHVAIELSRRALAAGDLAIRASSRELATACKASRRNVQAALDHMTSLNLITTRQGTTTSPAVYRLTFLETARMGGAKSTPPPGVESTPQGALFQRQGGADLTPPPTENTALTAAAAALQISSTAVRLIDRIHSAKAKDLDPATIATFRAWLHGYMCKLGRDENNRPTPNAHPPDDDLVARLLAIAEPRRIATLLDSLFLDRQPCYSYGWFLVVAMQRVHGLNFNEQKKARAALAVVRRAGRQAAAPPEQLAIPDAPTPDAGDLRDQLAATANSKRLR